MLAAAPLAAAPGVAHARVLEVGPGRPYDRPSAAAAAARAGDTVVIAPGTYYDCARWTADGLTIVGERADPAGSAAEAGVTLTDVACEGKAAFVISGDGVTVRDIGFARIRVPDDNGAGIRSTGRDLTVEDSRFVNTQVGILGESPGGGFLRVIGCDFREIGDSLTGRVNNAIHASGFDLARVERSSFTAARGGADMLLRAGRSELVGDRLADEGGHMRGPMVIVEGGALLLRDNVVELAAGAAARPGVVLATGEASVIAVRDNVMRDAGGGGTPLLRNWTGQPVTEAGNQVPAGGAAVSDAGLTYHRLRAAAAEARDRLHALLRAARHMAGEAARALR
jgi:hypothetical protein